MILTKPNHIKIYGHRGARGDLPENTLESFKYLFENKISAYETDILLTKDLIPVVYHDFRLNPALTKNAQGYIAQSYYTAWGASNNLWSKGIGRE